MSARLTAEQLVSNFHASGETQTYYGKVKVRIIDLAGPNASLNASLNEIQISWPGCGPQDTLATLQFASDLTEAARVVLECERLLTEAGYSLYRKEPI